MKRTNKLWRAVRRGATLLLVGTLLCGLFAGVGISTLAAETEKINFGHTQDGYYVSGTGSYRYSGNTDWWYLVNGQEAVYKVTLSKYAVDFKIPQIDRYSTCKNIIVEVSKDGQTWLPFATFGTGTLASSYQIYWNEMTTTPANAKVVLADNPTKTVYIKLKANETDGSFTYGRVYVESTIDAGELDLRTATQSVRVDAQPTDATSPDIVAEDKLLVSMEHATTDTLADAAGKRTSYRGLYSEAAQITYLVDFNDRAVSFTVGGWGRGSNYRMLVSKDGREWLTASEQVGSAGIGSLRIPADTDSLYKDAMNWVLAGNPEKKVYFRFMPADDGYFEYVNLMFNCVYNVGADTVDAPSTTDGLQKPAAFDGDTTPKGVSKTSAYEYRFDVYPISGKAEDIKAFNQSSHNVVSDQRGLVAVSGQTVKMSGASFFRRIEGADGSLVYRYDMDERTAAFSIGGWGAGKNFTILLSKDNVTYYKAVEVSQKNMGAISYSSADATFKKAMEWVLSGNPDKYVYVKVLTKADGYFEYCNIMLNATINGGKEVDPTLSPDPADEPDVYDGAASAVYTATGDAGTVSADKTGLYMADGNASVLLTDVTDATPNTVEAWVKMPANLPAGATGGTILESKTGITLDVLSGGKLRFNWNYNEAELIVDNAALYTGEWIHVAVVRDAAAGRITAYINGEAVGYLNRAGSDISGGDTYRVGVSTGNSGRLGRDMNTKETDPFLGEIAAVTLWSTARTAAEVKSDMNALPAEAKTGLIASFDLSAMAGQDLRDLDMATAVLDVEDAGGSDALARMETFQTYVDSAVAEGDYTLVAIPDTQTIIMSTDPAPTNAIGNWIADNADALNIEFAMHLGDVVYMNNDWEWDNAVKFFDLFDDVVPYSIAMGNHDYTDTGKDRNADKYHAAFPYEAMSQIDGFAGAYEEGMTDNVYYTFTAGDTDWLVLVLEFGPRDGVLEWANSVVTANPDKKVIVTTHAYMSTDGTRLNGDDDGALYDYGIAGTLGDVNDGNEIWDKFVRRHENIVMVLSGHVTTETVARQVSIGDNGNRVLEIAVDAQETWRHYEGMLLLMTFKNGSNDVEFRYYSPQRDRYYNVQNQFVETLSLYEVKEELPPESSEPESSEPESSEPESSEPTSSAPESSEPAPSAPESSEPEESTPESAETSEPASENDPVDTGVALALLPFVTTALAAAGVTVARKKRPQK